MGSITGCRGRGRLLWSREGLPCYPPNGPDITINTEFVQEVMKGMQTEISMRARGMRNYLQGGQGWCLLWLPTWKAQVIRKGAGNKHLDHLRVPHCQVSGRGRLGRGGKWVSCAKKVTSSQANHPTSVGRYAQYCQVSHFQKEVRGTSLVVRWLRLHTPNAEGPHSIPGWGTRSHRPQQRVCMP